MLTVSEYAKNFGVTRKVSREEARRLAVEARNRKADARRKAKGPKLAALLDAALEG